MANRRPRRTSYFCERKKVEFLVDVSEVNPRDITLAEHVGKQISAKVEDRMQFNLIESSPVTVSDSVQGHETVYTFVKDDEDEPRYGHRNKILRTYAMEDDCVYTLAYIAESDRYSTYLPDIEEMIGSIRIL